MKAVKTILPSSTWIYFGMLVPVLALGLFTGCATINPEPFTKYRAAVDEAQSGIDAAMSVNYDWARSGFVDGFSSNPDSKFSKLIIQPGEGYLWSLPQPPLYLKVKEVRTVLAVLNTAFADYADLLAKLAGRELVSTAKFDQLAKDLNANTKDAAKALSLDVQKEGFALFSVTASEAARLYIENKRQKYLKEAIAKNQANVDRYSTLCISLLQTIRGNIKTYYVERSEPIRIAWNATSGEKRHNNTEAMLELNEQFADTMRVLQELETAYGALPEAHADLIKAIEKPEFNVEGIQKLYASGKRLQRLYSELVKTESKPVKIEQP